MGIVTHGPTTLYVYDQDGEWAEVGKVTPPNRKGMIMNTFRSLLRKLFGLFGFVGACQRFVDAVENAVHERRGYTVTTTAKRDENMLWL